MNSNSKPAQTNNSSAKKPNETGAVSVQGFIKIFDPVSKQVFVEKRA